MGLMGFEATKRTGNSIASEGPSGHDLASVATRTPISTMLIRNEGRRFPPAESASMLALE